MKIVLAGGSGQVGTILARRFIQDGHDVVVLSRRHHSAPWRIRSWDGRTHGDWVADVDGANVVINLAGRSVDCRYNARNRDEIMRSRVESTRAVGEALRMIDRPPRLWLQMSTATIYEHTFGPPHDESGRIGGREEGVPETWRFSIDVATAWERAACDAAVSQTRRVLMRTAMVMSPDRGGIFDTLLQLVRRGLGGTAGDGRQYVSWIHDTDFLRAVYWLVEHERVSGPINIAAPNPLPNAEFMRVLRRTTGTRIGLPATKWMLEVGALLMGTETELILKSKTSCSRASVEEWV